MKVALTIAGSDPSGGAGIQADLKTFTRLGVYGTAVVTALTIQNTTGIQEVVRVPSDLFRKQLATLLEDVPIQAVKTGMILDAETIEIIQEHLKKYGVTSYVLDPIIRSSNGFPVLSKNDVEILKKLLFPLAMLVTPNLKEVEQLTGLIIRNERDMEQAAKEIQGMGPQAVLVKGGHLEGAAVDVLYDGTKIMRFRRPRITRKRIHGAGCVLSSAIVAGLARGLSLPKSIQQAKAFVYRAIQQAKPLGQGRMPLNLLKE